MRDFEAPDWHGLYYSSSRRKRFFFCPVGYYLYHAAGRDSYAEQPETWEYKLYAAKFRLSLASYVNNFFRRAVWEFYRTSHNFRNWKFNRFVHWMLEKELAAIEREDYKLDPKLVNAVIEYDEKIYSGERLAVESKLAVDNMLDLWAASPYPERLQRVRRLDWVNSEKFWQWQLGGVNFLLTPDLAYRQDQRLKVVDMSGVAFDEEYLRNAELYRVYARRFMGIPPDAVDIEFYDANSGEITIGGNSPDDFNTIFNCCAGEAAMWRDTLVAQASVAAVGHWRYAQRQNCRYCRFAQLCPAVESGKTNEE